MCLAEAQAGVDSGFADNEYVGAGVEVILLNVNAGRLRYLSEVLEGHFVVLFSSSANLEEVIRYADLLIGAVLVPGSKRSLLITGDMVRKTKQGSVFIDVAADQGGCVETRHFTTHSDPTDVVDGIVHYCVSNMPAVVPRTSTHTFFNVVLPYVLKLANLGFCRAVAEDSTLAKVVNLYGCQITRVGVAHAVGLPYTHLETLMEERAA